MATMAMSVPKYSQLNNILIYLSILRLIASTDFCYPSSEPSRVDIIYPYVGEQMAKKYPPRKKERHYTTPHAVSAS